MRTSVRLGVALGVVVLVVLAGASPVFAASAWWHLGSGSRPSTLEVESKGQIVVTADNLGDANMTGTVSPVSIVDNLPAGLKAVSIEGKAASGLFDGLVKCSLGSSSEGVCTFAGTLPPYDHIEIIIGVNVEEGARVGELNEVSVSGGGALAVTANRPLRIGGEPSFGVEDYELMPEEEGGAPDTQAGSHPFQLTSTVALNQSFEFNVKNGQLPEAVEPTKDLRFKLPPGLIGNPTPLPRCTLAQFLTVTVVEGSQSVACPRQTAIGVGIITLNEPSQLLLGTSVIPVFNLEPSGGEPARLAFIIAGSFIYLDASVRTGDDYGVTVSINNITEVASFLKSVVSTWGVPGDSRHDGARGSGCLGLARKPPFEPTAAAACGPLEAQRPPPFLALPTSCTGRPLETSVEADSWMHPGSFQSFSGEPMPVMDGCNRNPFSPSIKVTPDGTAGSSPTGVNVDVHVPQDSILSASGLAESNVRDISVTLPEGFAINPAGGDGLQACSEGQVGYLPLPVSSPPEGLRFTPTPKPPGESIEPGVNFCPNASKIGEVTIRSPLLPPTQPLQGFVYLATQNENPFGSLVALYIVVKDPISGTLVKLAGEARLTASGQIIGTFKNNPQLAFEDAELHFFGGERAPLSTPAHCGAYTTNATFTPWSGNEPVSSTSTFNITSGPGGAACPGASLPFSPTLTGGTTNINAGSFSPLTTTIGREDGNQDMQSVQLHMPPGLLGSLAGVKLCGEAEANAGTCGPESQIGETTVSAGVGPDPVSVKGGRVYITGPYHGAPFGLSIVNPVKAGPFDLERDTSNPGQQPPCDCIVVRARVELDPHTAVLSVTTNSGGEGYAIPHMIDGIPVQIKKVNVLINRERFTFNPTNCSPLTLTGAITGEEGASSPVQVPFQATNCAILKFAPKFSVSTTSKTSKANGASLTAKLSYPNAPQGTQANIAKVKVDLPKQLPSRLTTLQKACTNAQFEANPAACPTASRIGYATVHTPLIPVPLTGPAIFVSHGGEAFPSLTMVLQGYGVTIDLVGTTFISKAGITSTTFKTVPDTPFNTFELTLPQGKFSALAANGNLCKSKLAMPTAFYAQNGLQIHQSTKITITGCPKHSARRTSKTTHRQHK